MKGTKKKYKTNKKIRFKISVNTYPSITALHTNGLSAPIKRQRVEEWVRKQGPMICYLQEPTLGQRTHIFRGWKKRLHAN